MNDHEPGGLPTAPLLRRRYRLHELIGRGGNAAVYRGRDEALARDVAIKIYPSAIDKRDADRQEDEVNVLASLNHHALVTLLDAGIKRFADKPSVYLVMELVIGIDLQQLIARSRPTSRDISNIGYDMAEALQYIHNRGVVHRDVKPSNIMMVDYGDDGTRARAKLTDFGIAQYRTVDISDTGATTGTAAYLSPEQVRRAEVGPASDVYSLGLVLLECFTGVLAYPGEAVPSAIARLQHRPVFPASLSPDWRATIDAMTATNPADRPTASQLVHVMRNLVFSETGRHKSGETTSVDGVALHASPHSFDSLDTLGAGAFDRIARIAASAMRTPIAIVSIVDMNRNWFTSFYGLDSTTAAKARMLDLLSPLDDLLADPHTLANPLVAAEAGLGFYAGVPLRTRDGYIIGTLCVLDIEPRTAQAQNLAMLEDLAAVVVDELELRFEVRQSALSRDTEEPLASI